MTGGSSKMSSSVNSGSSIFLTDDGDTIRNKVLIWPMCLEIDLRNLWKTDIAALVFNNDSINDT